MPGIQRKYTGPQGYLNFIPDNVDIDFTRNAAHNIIRIDITGPHGEAFHRIITRDAAERVTDVGFWIQDAI